MSQILPYLQDVLYVSDVVPDVINLLGGADVLDGPDVPDVLKGPRLLYCQLARLQDSEIAILQECQSSRGPSREHIYARGPRWLEFKGARGQMGSECQGSRGPDGQLATKPDGDIARLQNCQIAR